MCPSVQYIEHIQVLSSALGCQKADRISDVPWFLHQSYVCKVERGSKVFYCGN
jgi:hypothetical protein